MAIFFFCIHFLKSELLKWKNRAKCFQII
jgi:hypothetical protein